MQRQMIADNFGQYVRITIKTSSWVSLSGSPTRRRHGGTVLERPLDGSWQEAHLCTTRPSNRPGQRSAWPLSPSAASADGCPRIPVPRRHLFSAWLSDADSHCPADRRASSEATLVVVHSPAWPIQHHHIQAPGRGGDGSSSDCLSLPSPLSLSCQTRVHNQALTLRSHLTFKVSIKDRGETQTVSIQSFTLCEQKLPPTFDGKKDLFCFMLVTKDSWYKKLREQRQDRLSNAHCLWKNMHTDTKINYFNSGLSRSLKGSKG